MHRVGLAFQGKNHDYKVFHFYTRMLKAFLFKPFTLFCERILKKKMLAAATADAPHSIPSAKCFSRNAPPNIITGAWVTAKHFLRESRS